MKKFVGLALAAVFTLTLAGCCGNRCCYRNKNMSPAEAACAKDIAQHIKDYKKSPELVPQAFNAPCAEKLYNSVAYLKQKKDINTLSYTMANVETGVVSYYLFDRDQNAMKISCKKNGKLLSVVIYKYDNGVSKALESKDGVTFYTIHDQEKLNSFRFLYDLKMNFNDFAQKICTPIQKTYSYNDGKQEVVLSAREMAIDGKRCNTLKVHFVTNDYTADLKLKVDAFTKDLLGMRVLSAEELPQCMSKKSVAFTRAEKNGNFLFYAGNDFQVGNKGKVVSYSISNIKVNEPIDAKEFDVPVAKIIDVTTVTPKKEVAKKATAKKVAAKNAKKVDAKKVDAKKTDAKKADAKKADAKKTDAKKADAKKADAKQPAAPEKK